ncbi:MAG: nucleotidyltransferase domain-containing protein [Fervidicoccaceae archaeon]|nr:nucleotidyltransferase domain-containing protein [Fervidicoccaceae archaeon]MCC6052181.1 nucleotidyltransferase domain-containing protein [Fervidicoccaceae archaeon]
MHRYFEHLKKSKKDLEENIDKYLSELRKLATIYKGRLYIFGSYLKGEYIAASDVDVLLEVPDSVDRLQVLHEARRLVKNRRIELHVLNHSDAEEFKKIIKEYKEIS